MLSSQGLVLASGHCHGCFCWDHHSLRSFKEKYFSNPNLHQNQDSPHPQKMALKSCLVSNSGDQKSDQRKKNNKRRVEFAEDVKDSDKNINGELYRKEVQRSCGNEMVGIQKIPANHVALYSGILGDRVRRMQYSY